MVFTGLHSLSCKLRCTRGQGWHYKHKRDVALASWPSTWQPSLTMTVDTLSDILFTLGFEMCLGQSDHKWAAQTCLWSGVNGDIGTVSPRSPADYLCSAFVTAASYDEGLRQTMGGGFHGQVLSNQNYHYVLHWRRSFHYKTCAKMHRQVIWVTGSQFI